MHAIAAGASTSVEKERLSLLIAIQYLVKLTTYSIY
jgi:hypothetical protein